MRSVCKQNLVDASLKNTIKTEKGGRVETRCDEALFAPLSINRSLLVQGCAVSQTHMYEEGWITRFSNNLLQTSCKDGMIARRGAVPVLLGYVDDRGWWERGCVNLLEMLTSSRVV